MKNFIENIITSEPLLFAKGALIFLIGPLNLQLAYLLLAICIDLSFGAQVARKENQFEWNVLFQKVRQKLFIYGMWIAMFHAFDMIAGLPYTARWSVILMLAGMEIFSAAKNTARLGHGKLADALEALYLSLIKNTPALNKIKPPEDAEQSNSKETTISERSKEDEEPKKESK